MIDDQKKVVTDLLIPTDSPAPVRRAHAEYEAAVEALNTARADLDVAEDAIVPAGLADVQETKSAIGAGTTAADPHAHTRKARETRDDAATLVSACEQIVHERGDALLESIDTAKREWLDALDVKLSVVAREYHEALATVRDSMRAIGSTRWTFEWLQRFSAHKMGHGNAPPGTSRVMRYREPVDHEIKLTGIGRSMYDETIEAMPMLDTLATLVDATPTTAAA
jgi:hypothetical protein